MDSDASPAGAGHVRGPHMSWLQAGFVLFAFAAPSAVMAFPYCIGQAGFIGGSLICLVITGASSLGSWMLLQVKIKHPQCHTFGDLGRAVMGPAGQVWGNAVQLGNFCMFLPCALQFCALALKGIGQGIPSFDGCNDYYVFAIASVCLLTTQVRHLGNTQVMSIISIICVFAMAAIMIFAAFTYEVLDHESNPAKIPARLLGNPHPGLQNSMLRAAGGFTIASWAYVPAFLTVELSSCMERPQELTKSLVVAGTLNVVIFLLVGLTVVARWGYDVGEVITITGNVKAWSQGAAINTAFNAFQLIGNFVSYMLDSVPLARFCQKTWAPHFRDSWSAGDVLRYLGYTLPTFTLGLLLSVFLPNVNTLLDFTTAFTTPMVTQIYPAVLYWTFSRRRPSLVSADDEFVFSPEARKTTLRQHSFVAIVMFVGIVNFVVCLIKAIGYLVVPELRPPMQIGCGSWLIWKASPTVI